MQFDVNGAAPKDSGIFGLPYGWEESKLILIPVPWEATTSYGEGTAQGPAAILKASRQMDLFDLELKDPFSPGIHCLSEDPSVRRWNTEARESARLVLEAGGVQAEDLTQRPAVVASAKKVDSLSEKLNDWVFSQTTRIIEAGKIVGLVGGDHSTPYGAIRAAAHAHGSFGILHFDAHADTRNAYEGFRWSHASIMRNVLEQIPEVKKIVQVGIRDFCEEEFEYAKSHSSRIRTFYDLALKNSAFDGEPWRKTCKQIVAELPATVWISFDIDGLDPKLCPNTGTPVPGGLEFEQALGVIREVVHSGRKIIGFDLNEVAPGENWEAGSRAADEWDANVGMRLLYKLCGWTFASQGLVSQK
jgi:agmatinase